MSLFAANIQMLRSLRGASQDVAGIGCELKRARLSALELDLTEPRGSELLRIANYYKIQLGPLLTLDLSKMRPSMVEQQQRAFIPYTQD